MNITLGDANHLIRKVRENSVDLIATDPPYEINFENNDWDRPDGLNWHHLASEFKRVLKPGGGLVVFQGWSRVAHTKTVLDGHFTLKNWIIYDRVKGRGVKNKGLVYQKKQT